MRSSCTFRAHLAENQARGEDFTIVFCKSASSCRTCAKAQLYELEGARKEDGELWSTIETESKKLIDENDLSWEEMKRTSKPPKRFQDAIVTDVTGSRSFVEGEDHYRHFKIHTFFPVLDRIISELRRRFSDENNEILKSISYLDPQSDKFLDIIGLSAMAKTYGLNIEDLKAECHSLKRLLARKDSSLKTLKDLADFVFPYKEPFFEIMKLIQIAMTLPVGSASCERSFSRLRIIKTYLRNTMADARLDNLATISMNRQRAENLDLDKIVLQFAQQHQNRRIPLL